MACTRLQAARSTRGARAQLTSRTRWRFPKPSPPSAPARAMGPGALGAVRRGRARRTPPGAAPQNGVPSEGGGAARRRAGAFGLVPGHASTAAESSVAGVRVGCGSRSNAGRGGGNGQWDKTAGASSAAARVQTGWRAATLGAALRASLRVEARRARLGRGAAHAGEGVSAAAARGLRASPQARAPHARKRAAAQPRARAFFLSASLIPAAGLAAPKRSMRALSFSGSISASLSCACFAFSTAWGCRGGGGGGGVCAARPHAHGGGAGRARGRGRGRAAAAAAPSRRPWWPCQSARAACAPSPHPPRTSPAHARGAARARVGGGRAPRRPGLLRARSAAAAAGGRARVAHQAEALRALHLLVVVRDAKPARRAGGGFRQRWVQRRPSHAHRAAAARTGRRAAAAAALRAHFSPRSRLRSSAVSTATASIAPAATGAAGAAAGSAACGGARRGGGGWASARAPPTRPCRPHVARRERAPASAGRAPAAPAPAPRPPPRPRRRA